MAPAPRRYPFATGQLRVSRQFILNTVATILSLAMVLAFPIKAHQATALMLDRWFMPIDERRMHQNMEWDLYQQKLRRQSGKERA